VSVFALNPNRSQFDFTIVAQTSTPAPVPSQLSSTSAPAVNNRGDVVFNGDGAVFLKTSSGLTTIAKIGDPAPGGGKFISAGLASLNSQGQIFVEGIVSSPSHSGLFLYANGMITQLVRDGSPNFNGNIFTFEAPSINDHKDVAFVADNGIFVKSKGVITK